MSDLDDLLNAIRANPADDAVRLIYADSLCALGEMNRAEFIRVQVELAQRGNYDHDTNQPGIGIKWVCRCGREQICDHCIALREREYDLWLEACHDGWLGSIRDVCCCAALKIQDACDMPAHGFPRRGFIAEFRCPTARWLQIGPGLVRAANVVAEAVKLTDKEPWRGSLDPENYSEFGVWYDLTPPRGIHPQSDLPAELYQSLRGNRPDCKGRTFFETEALASAALSEACIRWAWSVTDGR